MVGIVIVSHSKTLAAGVKELADQMSQNKVGIIAVGGLDDLANPIGTDPFQIKTAIEKLEKCDGILVLMDIGSAVMNAELALDLIDEGLKNKTFLCEAPLVEGAVTAAAQAMVGASLEQVVNEARNSLIGKEILLAPIFTKHNEHAELHKLEKEFNITVPNELGLHARPSVKLVAMVNSFKVKVMVSTNGKPFIAANSISQIGTLGAKKGDVLHFKYFGEESDEFEKALKQFAQDNFGDPLKSMTVTSSKDSTRKNTHANDIIKGMGVSKGIAIGQAKLLKNMSITVEKKQIDNTETEIMKLTSAIQNVLHDIVALQQKTMALSGQENADIFDFHISILKDSVTVGKAQKFIQNENYSADFAWFMVFNELEKRYLNMDSEYLRARSSDIAELRSKVINEISGNLEKTIVLTQPAILIVDEIGPAQTLGLDTDKVLGIISMSGGETSHATILARSLGIPAITSVGKSLHDINEADIIAMNGTTGDIFLEKKQPEKISELTAQKKIENALLEKRSAKAKEPAISNDGVQFKIMANISSPKEAKMAFDNGAEGVGLYRTEFLYMNRTVPPTEDEQYQIYLQACANMKGLPITIRTLDIGGDKQIPYMGIGDEENPFLGLRGIRFCLKNVEIFKTQLRALCRVSAEYQIRIMYPMVGVLEEIRAANKILKEVQESLEEENILFDSNMQVGIMVEVPSVIFLIPQLASEINFLSIGTNDLTQYLLALDRENTNVSKYFSALHPSVLCAIQKIIELADNEQIDVSLCGEIARDAKATDLLSQLGLRKFSMSSPAIPNIKEVVRSMNVLSKPSTLSINKRFSTLQEVTNYLKDQ